MWQGEWEGHPVAIQVVKGASLQAVEALLREVEVATSIKLHPNLVAVYGVCDGAGDELQLVLEYCEDGSLLDWLRRLEKVRVCSARDAWQSPRQHCAYACVVVCMRAARALCRSRCRRRWMCSHKWLAVCVTCTAAACGTATSRADCSRSRTCLSSVASDIDAVRMTSMTIGPVAWRAPETFHLDESKRQIASVQTDVYMLGGLMFEVLTAGRRAPFFWMASEGLIILRATTTVSTLDAAAAAGVSIPWAVVPGDDWTGVVDGVERLKALMSRCLHADPSRRPLDGRLPRRAGCNPHPVIGIGRWLRRGA